MAKDDLKDQVERERNGEASDEDAKAEARRAKDRERKRKSRAAGGSVPRVGTPSAAAKEAAEVTLDPRVVKAVQMCLQACTVEDVTPEFEKEMQEALAGALQYEIEVRLPLVADEYAPEIGLGTAIVGAGVTKFRAKRRKAKLAKNDPNATSEQLRNALESIPPADPVQPVSPVQPVPSDAPKPIDPNAPPISDASADPFNIFGDGKPA